jgi:hypothetical protein
LKSGVALLSLPTPDGQERQKQSLLTPRGAILKLPLLIRSWLAEELIMKDSQTLPSHPRFIRVSDSELVGQRTYSINGSDVLTLRIGRPVEDHGNFRCDIQIVEFENESIFTMGVDSVAALDNALWMAGTVIHRISEERFEGLLTWVGAEEGKPIGLPRIPESYSSVDSPKGY